MKSTIQSQPARSRRRSTSEASSDSIISGPTITVEAYRPAQNPGPSPTLESPKAKTLLSQQDPRPKKASSLPATPTVPSKTLQNRSPLKSLTPHYPISGLRGKSNPSSRSSSKVSSRIEPPHDDNGLNISSQPKKQKRSPESSYNPVGQLASFAGPIASAGKPSVFSPFRTIQQYFTKKPTPNENKVLAAGQTASSSKPNSDGQAETAANGASTATKPQMLVEVSLQGTENAGSTRASHSASIAASSIRNSQQDASMTQNRNEVNIHDEESDASSSSTSSILPHQTITVQPYFLPSNGYPTQSQSSLLKENSSRRPSNKAYLHNGQTSEHAQSTQRLLASRSSPPKESRIATSK